MTALIRTRDLVRRFGRAVAVDGIDLDVEEGESLALLGPNGSGRTTLLHMLAALVPPTSGTVEIAGIDAARFPFEARAHVMYVGSHLPAADGLRVQEYLDFVRGARGGRATRGPGTTTMRALERSALPAGASVLGLSTGLRKQLALAAALLVAPRVLLLDDPFASLDADGRRRFLAWLTETRTAGTTIVAAVNDADDGHALCGSFVRMQQGRIVSRATSIATAPGSYGALAGVTGGA